MSTPRHKESAGLLMFRLRDGRLEVLLGHPGGPFWEGRHDGAWTVPKGGIERGETPLESAVREFKEETGFDAMPPFHELGTNTQRSGKRVQAWVTGDDLEAVTRRRVTLEHRLDIFFQVPEHERPPY